MRMSTQLYRQRCWCLVWGAVQHGTGATTSADIHFSLCKLAVLRGFLAKRSQYFLHNLLHRLLSTFVRYLQWINYFAQHIYYLRCNRCTNGNQFLSKWSSKSCPDSFFFLLHHYLPLHKCNFRLNSRQVPFYYVRFQTHTNFTSWWHSTFLHLYC